MCSDIYVPISFKIFQWKLIKKKAGSEPRTGSSEITCIIKSPSQSFLKRVCEESESDSNISNVYGSEHTINRLTGTPELANQNEPVRFTKSNTNLQISWNPAK